MSNLIRKIIHPKFNQKYPILFIAHYLIVSPVKVLIITSALLLSGIKLSQKVINSPKVNNTLESPVSLLLISITILTCLIFLDVSNLMLFFWFLLIFLVGVQGSNKLTEQETTYELELEERMLGQARRLLALGLPTTEQDQDQILFERELKRIETTNKRDEVITKRAELDQKLRDYSIVSDNNNWTKEEKDRLGLSLKDKANMQHVAIVRKLQSYCLENYNENISIEKISESGKFIQLKFREALKVNYPEIKQFLNCKVCIADPQDRSTLTFKIML